MLNECGHISHCFLRTSDHTAALSTLHCTSGHTALLITLHLRSHYTSDHTAPLSTLHCASDHTALRLIIMLISDHSAAHRTHIGHRLLHVPPGQTAGCGQACVMCGRNRDGKDPECGQQAAQQYAGRGEVPVRQRKRDGRDPNCVQNLVEAYARRSGLSCRVQNFDRG